jgi:hypothetical protein
LVETPPTPFADRILSQDLPRSKPASAFDGLATSKLFQASDIESFIAQVTVPPPPDDSVAAVAKLSSKELRHSSHSDIAGQFSFGGRKN